MTMSHLREERGFTLVELLVASLVTVIVLGGAASLAGQIQNGYRRQLEDSAGEQEARYAIEWIGRYIRGADNNPFAVATSDCPAAGTVFTGIVMDPDLDGEDDDITLQTDSNPPDGLIGGAAAACTQANEHVTISYNDADFTIEFLDEAVGEDATTRTDSVIGGLRFVYRDSAHNVTAVAADVVYIETQITIRSRTGNSNTGTQNIRALSSEIRVRSR